MIKASLAQWLERLETLHPNAMELGLERVSKVAARLQLLPLPGKVVTVAGTNGKGSTSAVLEALLLRTGRSVGVHSSPHFLRFNERIRIDGHEAGDQSICDAFARIDAARGEISLTYFEFASLAALLLFRENKVDVSILEVGLGGRLDAVNIVDATVSVITSIALDHQEWLGDTRDAIAVEKAGIFRRDQRAVISDPEPPVSLEKAAMETGVDAYYVGRDFHLREDAGRWSVTLRSPGGTTREVQGEPPGGILSVNIAAALQAMVCLEEDFSDTQLTDALAELRLPGRRETVELAGLQYILDVAHNPAAINKLLEYIDITPCNGKTIALFSVMADKDIHSMLEPCGGVFDGWFLADQPRNSRAADAAMVAETLRAQGERMISTSKNVRQAFRRAQTLMAPDDRLVVFGSFFTVADVMPLLEKDRRKLLH